MKIIRLLSATWLVLCGFWGHTTQATPLLMDLNIYCAGSSVRGDQLFYALPVLTTTNPPLTYHQVYSPQTNLQYGIGPGSTTSTQVYPSLGELLAEFTAGSWTLMLNVGDPSQAIYNFTVTPRNIVSNLFPNVQVLSPTNGLVGAGRKPAYNWIGPTHWQALTVEVYDDNSIVDVTANLSRSATNWTAGPTLVSGANYFDVTYTSNAAPFMTISVPLDSSSNAPAGWASSSTLVLTDQSQFQVGNPGASFTNTLVAHYSFDNPANLGHDDSGNGNDALSSGTLPGGTLPAYTAAGVAGGAVQFSGSNWFMLSTNLLSALAHDFSVSLWLSTTQVSGLDTAQGYATAGIVSAERYAVLNDVVPMALTGHKLGLFTGDPDSTLHSESTIDTGTFLHLAVTHRQGTGERNIYINGQVDASDYGSTNLLNAATNIFIGFTSGNSSGIQGTIDDVQIYSGVLNDSEVAYLADHPGATVANANPLSVYVLDASFSGSTFQISFPSSVGHNYTVQTCTNLAGGGWAELFTVAGDGTVKQFGLQPSAAQQEFYRVKTD